MKDEKKNAKDKIRDVLKDAKTGAEEIKNSPGSKKLNEKLKKADKKGNRRLLIITISALVIFPIAIFSCRSQFNNNLFNAEFQSSSSKSSDEGKEADGGEGILSASSSDQETVPLLTSSTSTVKVNEEIENPSLTVTFLHTKNGNCTFARSENFTMLIDTGSQDDYDYIMDYLSAQNITSLDYLVLTGSSEDVCGNADDIINQISVKSLITLRYKDSRSDFYKLALKAARKRGTNVAYTARGEQFAFGNSTISVVAPDNDVNRSEDETIIFYLISGDRTFLFGGDAQSDEFVTALSWSNQQGISLKADILYSSDHGADSGYSEKFYMAAEPKYVVIDQNADEKQISSDMVTAVQNAGGMIYRLDKLSEQENLTCSTNGEKLAITAKRY